MDWARIAGKLREKIVQFSGKLCSSWPKVLCRFVAEMVYGAQVRQSVRLTEVSRGSEEEVLVKKNAERLSLQLGDGGYEGK